MVGPKLGVPNVANAEVVVAPTTKGIFVLRSLIMDEDKLADLIPERSIDVNTVAGFRFPDTREAFTVHVRRGVAEIRPQFPENPDITLTVDSTVWKEVVTGFRNPAIALVKDVDKEGGTLEIIKFLSLLKSDD